MNVDSICIFLTIAIALAVIFGLDKVDVKYINNEDQYDDDWW